MTRNLLEQEPGRVESHANAAATPNISLLKQPRQSVGMPDPVTSGPGEIMQIGYLRRVHGLTEGQAKAVAALVWGG